MCVAKRKPIVIICNMNGHGRRASMHMFPSCICVLNCYECLLFKYSCNILCNVIFICKSVLTKEAAYVFMFVEGEISDLCQLCQMG